jgi:hypothetical protein
MSYNNEQKSEIDLAGGGANSLSSDDFFSAVYNKSYRLCTAVYLVSNLICEGEQLRTRIKGLALDLVSLSVSLKDLQSLNVLNTIGNIEKKSLELMSLLDIAANSGLVSDMNSSIIKSEFNSFLKDITSYSDNFKYLKSGYVKSVFSKPHSVDRRGDSSLTDMKLLNSNNNDNDYDAHQSEANITGHKSHKRKDVRKDLILDFVKRHSGASIKDIFPNIKGCSEKTVQRELMGLIKAGLIRKEGERRWSRYF